MSTAHVLLVVIGWPVETFGVLFVAAPDWLPPARAALRRSWSRARRFLRLPVVVHAGTGTATARVRLTGVGVVSLSADAPVERRLAFLMDQVEQIQGRIGRVENEVAEGLERRWLEAIERAVGELRAEVSTGLAQVRGEYLPVRRVGVALLVVGGLMLAAANIVA